MSANRAPEPTARDRAGPPGAQAGLAEIDGARTILRRLGAAHLLFRPDARDGDGPWPLAALDAVCAAAVGRALDALAGGAPVFRILAAAADGRGLDLVAWPRPAGGATVIVTCGGGHAAAAAPEVERLAAAASAAERRAAEREAMAAALGIEAVFVDRAGRVSEVWATPGRPAAGIARGADAAALAALWPQAPALVARALAAGEAREEGGLAARPFGRAPGRFDGVALTAARALAVGCAVGPGVSDDPSGATAAYLRGVVEAEALRLARALFRLVRRGAPPEAVAPVAEAVDRLRVALDAVGDFDAAAEAGAAAAPQTIPTDWIAERFEDAWADRLRAAGARLVVRAPALGPAEVETDLDRLSLALDCVVEALIGEAGGALVELAVDWRPGAEGAAPQAGAIAAALRLARAAPALPTRTPPPDLRLRTAERLLRAAGGALRVSAGAGETLCDLSIPAAAVPEDPVAAAARRLRGMRACVRLECADSADALCAALGALGCSVRRQDAAGALEDALRVERFEVVFLDLLGSEAHSADLVRSLRRGDWASRGARCVAVAEPGLAPAILRHLERGFDAVLARPVDRGALVETLAPLLDAAR